MKLNTKFMVKTFWLALEGVPTTLKLTFITLFISMILGFLLALVKLNKKGIGNFMATAYVSFIRGTPVVLQILFLYSIFPSLLNYVIKEILKLNINVFEFNPIIYAYMVFILNTTAVLTEVFRSALSAIPKGQMEAALSVGLNIYQAYIRIIIPQAFVSAMPNICNTTVNLLKSTSLAFMMTVKDVTAIAKIEAAYGYNYIEAYLDILLIYILLCTTIQILFRFIEERVSAYKKTSAV